MAVRDAIVKATTSLGYSKLKLEQDQAIAYFVSDNDVFVALPTGYGKSLCFVVTQSVRHAVYLGYLVSDVLPSCFVLRTRSNTPCCLLLHVA